MEHAVKLLSVIPYYVTAFNCYSFKSEKSALIVDQIESLVVPKMY